MRCRQGFVEGTNMQLLRLQLRSCLLSQSSSGALFNHKVAPAPKPWILWCLWSRPEVGSPWHASAYVWHSSKASKIWSFRLSNAKVHKLQVTVLFEKAWWSYHHFRFFLNNSLFISNLFGAKYANKDTLPILNVTKMAKLDTGIIEEIYDRLACYVSEWSPLALYRVVISEVFFSRITAV